MRYVIDGYNLLFAVGKLGPQSGKNAPSPARRWLLQQLREYRLPGSEVVVVFDGHGGDRTEGDLSVRFARRLSADDVIEEIIQREPDAARLAVISNDNRLRLAGRRRGCVVLDCLDFYELLSRKGGQAPATAPPELQAKPETSSPEDADHWLREFGDVGDDPLLRDPF